MTKPFSLRTSSALMGAVCLTALPVVVSAQTLDAQDARHLISRTGFGASPAEVANMIGRTRTQAVDQILANLSSDPSTPMPPWTTAAPYPVNDIWALGATAGELFITNRYLEIEDLASWWIAEMIETPSPLTERLTLFWHDHFATSFDADENSQWMAAQTQTIRRHAAGNFTDLAHAMLRDPAMLSYLTNTENVKDAPNENLAREFFELFTLGEGRGYTEADVKEAARALTGFGVSELGAPTFAFYGEDHDFGRKSILGQSGRFDAKDLPDLAIEHDAFGTYIVEKLWRAFISDRPSPEEVAALSETWRAADWEMKPLLREMFLSDAFWDVASRGRLIKSPVELLVGTVRTFGVPVPHTGGLNWAAEDMGQMLFFPPNVGGWPEGTAWINESTALARSVTLDALIEGGLDEPAGVAMVSSGPKAVAPTTPLAGADLIIGDVFAIDAETHEDGIGAMLSLIDVTYQGERLGSLSLWVEMEHDEPPFAAIFIGQCACLESLPREEDDPDWAYVAFDDPETLEGISSADMQIASGILQNLPVLLGATKPQATWTDTSEEAPADFAVFSGLAEVISASAHTLFDRPAMPLSILPRDPVRLGLAGLSAVTSEDDLDAYIEAQEQSMVRSATPRFVYDSMGDWEAAVAELGLRPADMLHAVPSTSQDMPIPSLVLSPSFQVN